MELKNPLWAFRRVNRQLILFLPQQACGVLKRAWFSGTDGSAFCLFWPLNDFSFGLGNLGAGHKFTITRSFLR